MAKHLTQRQIETAKPGRHTDLFGLSLMVRGNSKQWIWRGTIRGTGQHVQIGLGAWNLYELDEVREIALKYKRMAREGIDPRAKAQEDAPTPTLADAIGKVIDIKRSDWKDPANTEARWRSTMATHGKRFMNQPIDAIGTGDVEAALLRIREQHRSMLDLQRYLSAAFSWAVVHGHRTDNPADLVKSQLPKAPKVQHQKSIRYCDLADAIQTINKSGAQAATKLAIEFLVLTATRSGEVRGARWEEIDLAARTWTIPAERMKAGREHRVPLSDRCMAILNAAKPLATNDLVFPGRTGKELSHGSLNKLMRDLKLAGTPHGFRSSFADWAAECTEAPREVREDALAHVSGSTVERAYRRGDFFNKRRDLMNEWAKYAAADNVVTLHRATA